MLQGEAESNVWALQANKTCKAKVGKKGWLWCTARACLIRVLLAVPNARLCHLCKGKSHVKGWWTWVFADGARWSPFHPLLLDQVGCGQQALEV